MLVDSNIISLQQAKMSDSGGGLVNLGDKISITTSSWRCEGIFKGVKMQNNALYIVLAKGQFSHII